MHDFDRFSLDHNFVLYERIQSEAWGNRLLAINHWNIDFTLNFESACLQLQHQALRVYAFQQSWPERFVNLKNRVDDDRRDSFGFGVEHVSIRHYSFLIF